MRADRAINPPYFSSRASVAPLPHPPFFPPDEFFLTGTFFPKGESKSTSLPHLGGRAACTRPLPLLLLLLLLLRGRGCPPSRLSRPPHAAQPLGSRTAAAPRPCARRARVLQRFLPPPPPRATPRRPRPLSNCAAIPERRLRAVGGKEGTRGGGGITGFRTQTEAEGPIR